MLDTSDCSEKRRGGRPALSAEPSKPVCVKLTPRMYERVSRIAERQESTVPEVIRHALAHVLRDV